ncbi:MAG: signal recognition particle-docking protein FtsY [Dokdonella sp.]
MFKFWKKKPSDEMPGNGEQVDDGAVEAGEIDSAILTADAAGPMDEMATLVAEAQVSAAERDNDVRQTSDAEESEHRAAVEALSDPAPLVEEIQARRSWRERLGGSSFSRGLGPLFARNPILDDDLLDELETLLITADVGVAASTELVERLRKRVADRNFADAAALLAALRADLLALLQPVEQPLQIVGAKPFVILVVGVNGAGKTTTIGKLARHQKAAGKSVVLAAGDTFRAAAVQQLTTWGERNGIPVIAQGSGADSASVIFDALQTAGSRRVDMLIADTAGRLHTQTGLMDELSKIRRVLARFDATAPHEVLLVIDGTTGQNAINQTRQFRQAIGVTGLVVTKLDGTAKGGVVFALAREFGLPIRYVGLGEKIEDLRVFEAAAFVDGLLPSTLAKAG